MKLVFLMILFFFSIHSQQLVKNLKTHYKEHAIYLDKTVRPIFAFDYWREDKDWNIPKELEDSEEFRSFHNYLRFQISELSGAHKAHQYKTALLSREVIHNRILLYLYNHQHLLQLFEYHKVKMISVSFGGIPVFYIQIYQNIYIDVHDETNEK